MRLTDGKKQNQITVGSALPRTNWRKYVVTQLLSPFHMLCHSTEFSAAVKLTKTCQITLQDLYLASWKEPKDEQGSIRKLTPCP